MRANRGANKPPMRIGQILKWADEHHDRTGRWPYLMTGRIHAAPRETWSAVEHALREGLRGLPGGSSLARLLDEQRGHRNNRHLPRLTVQQILTWADAHHQRTGNWPRIHSGWIAGTRGETWYGVNSALHQGCRGLPGGDTLARLLDRYRPTGRKRQRHRGRQDA